jgi:hypothetical protein
MACNNHVKEGNDGIVFLVLSEMHAGQTEQKNLKINARHFGNYKNLFG